MSAFEVFGWVMFYALAFVGLIASIQVMRGYRMTRVP